ncbi:MAG TPA: DJ-1/PfpI family protein [Actinomycetes bacterium]|jgi:transcriptional regulator GlxA family with amidase domain|nr:DJ-1/PfpI family protein [Actinomycetes bacterium]
MRIAVVVFEGFDELDAIGPLEVLRNAASMGDADLQVDLVTLDGAAEVTGSHGLRVGTDGPLDPDGTDLVVVPGGGWNDRGASGAWAEAERGELPAAIAAAHETGAVVATVCTGAMLATAAGLTRGRPAVTHHGAIDDLRAAGAEVVEARVVDDGDLVTAGGVTSGIDMALWLVERHFGAELANAVAAEIEHPRVGRVWRATPERASGR